MKDSNFHLDPHPRIKPLRRGVPLTLVVIDGLGERKKDEFNAVALAKTPHLDALKTVQGRWRLLKAHGTAVGLPSDDDMGNSEVGHNALGAGQLINQGAKCVDRALETGELFEASGWNYIKGNATANTLHLIGLLSDGGVHSRYDQLMLLIRGAVSHGVKRIRLHILHDGRDVEDGTSIYWIQRLSDDLECLGIDAKVASGGGRMKVTMDRYESDWSIVKRGWDAHVLGIGQHSFEDPVAGVKELRGQPGASDQQLDSWVTVDGNGEAVGTIEDGDAVVIFNFRADRVVEISKAFEYGDEFTFFDRVRRPKVAFAGMMQYDGELRLPSHFLVPPPFVERASEEYLVKGAKLNIFAASESQKIGHVTFFWNGNRSGTIDPTLETFVEIPSDKGITFDKRPQMKAAEIADAVCQAILSGKYDFIRCNFPNPDMVGHTGNLDATVEACAVVDECVGKILATVDRVKGRFLLTCDHGNAEDMVQRSKAGTPLYDAGGNPIPLTSHTLNPVPCAIGGLGLDDEVQFDMSLDKSSNNGEEPGLTNVTATFIEMLGFKAPTFYMRSLLQDLE